jgi:hypothetical protein
MQHLPKGWQPKLGYILLTLAFCLLIAWARTLVKPDRLGSKVKWISKDMKIRDMNHLISSEGALREINSIEYFDDNGTCVYRDENEKWRINYIILILTIASTSAYLIMCNRRIVSLRDT